MKKNLKRLAALLACAALVLPTFGCNKEKTDDENVTLKWVMIGPGKQKDSDKVWEKFNEKLQDYMPGVNVDFQVLNGDEFNEKWQLMMASKEEVDIVWTGFALASFTDEVNKGAYMPLDDLIAEYGKDMSAELEDWVFELGKVNGKIYTIPCYQRMATSPRGLRTRKEISDQYLDVEKLKKTFSEWETNPAKGQEFYDILADYLQKAKDAGKLGMGVGVGTVGNFNHTTKWDKTTVQNFSIDVDTMKVYFDYETEDKQLWYKNVNDWYKKGYVREDILSVQNPATDEVKNNYLMWQHSYDEDRAELETKQHGLPIEVIPLGNDWVIQNAVPDTGTAIAATSKNPEKAMQLINLLNSKPGAELYNLLTYGIEGEHYEKIGENRIKAFDYVQQGESNSKYGLWKWAIANTLNAWELEADREGLAEYVKSLDENALTFPTMGFKPSTEDVTVELAQINAVVQEYKNTLTFGVADDWKVVYDEFMDKLQKAGVEKVKQSLQTQLDEYLKNK